MGMLMDFYAGDAEKIVNALNKGDADMLANGRVVAAHADLSFNLSAEDLNQLVVAACALRHYPAMSFDQFIHATITVNPEADPEMGIHEMAQSFTDLFAAIPLDQAPTLYETWIAHIPDPPKAATPGLMKKWVFRIQSGMMEGLFYLVLTPILAVYWLFSPSFRKERRQNKLKREAAKAETVAEYTLNEAVSALITTCQTARAQGTKIIYAWSV